MPASIEACANVHFIEPNDQFRPDFNRLPFQFLHRLADHPLFTLPRLLELARTTRRDRPHDLYYDAGPDIRCRTTMGPDGPQAVPGRRSATSHRNLRRVDYASSSPERPRIRRTLPRVHARVRKSHRSRLQKSHAPGRRAHLCNIAAPRHSVPHRSRMQFSSADPRREEPLRV